MATSPEYYRLIGQVMSLGLSIVLALAMGLGAGYLADGWLGTTPWLTALGFLVGIGAGFLNVYRVLRLVGKQKDS